MTDYEDVEYSVEDGIANIEIDRPEVYNAFRDVTIAELNDVLRSALGDDDVYAIVLSGAGDGFCAGADVSGMPDWSEQTKEDYAAFLWRIQNVVRKLRFGSKPTAAVVDGPAIGAGCDFALACDVRYAGPDGLFREGFVRVGLIPGDGGAWLLPRLVGDSRARELLLTGSDVDAETAADIGLASSVTEDPMTEALEFAAQVRDLPAVAVQRSKDLANVDGSFEDYCERATEYQWECVNDPEHDEAVAAFNENREPEYDR